MFAEIAIEYPCEYHETIARHRYGNVVRKKSRFNVTDVPVIACACDGERLREAWLFDNQYDALTAFRLLHDELVSDACPMDYDGPDRGDCTRHRTPDEERLKLTLKIKTYGDPSGM